MERTLALAFHCLKISIAIVAVSVIVGFARYVVFDDYEIRDVWYVLKEPDFWVLMGLAVFTCTGLMMSFFSFYED